MIYPYEIRAFIKPDKDYPEGANLHAAFKSKDELKEWIRQNKNNQNIAWGVLSMTYKREKIHWTELI